MFNVNYGVNAIFQIKMAPNKILPIYCQVLYFYIQNEFVFVK
ncbi:hypothetical protein ELI_0264 [Eubacterium callanderi]|uniref:Uncharacterized protein n=1 Tax=Eubacterium callanderi TaxID=53442 RepID=E3GHZ8_9FIRM|nr:hypothetical protein ELI_0264 [Eubacterium callanderi]